MYFRAFPQPCLQLPFLKPHYTPKNTLVLSTLQHLSHLLSNTSFYPRNPVAVPAAAILPSHQPAFRGILNRKGLFYNTDHGGRVGTANVHMHLCDSKADPGTNNGRQDVLGTLQCVKAPADLSVTLGIPMEERIDPESCPLISTCILW